MLRTALERSTEGSRSAAKLLEVAQQNPQLNRLRVHEVMSQPVATLPLELTFGPISLHAARAVPASDLGGRRGRSDGLVTRTDYYRAANRMLPATTP